MHHTSTVWNLYLSESVFHTNSQVLSSSNYIYIEMLSRWMQSMLFLRKQFSFHTWPATPNNRMLQSWSPTPQQQYHRQQHHQYWFDRCSYKHRMLKKEKNEKVKDALQKPVLFSYHHFFFFFSVRPNVLVWLKNKNNAIIKYQLIRF